MDAAQAAANLAGIVRDSHHSDEVEPEVCQRPGLLEEPLDLTTTCARPSHHLPSTPLHLQSSLLGEHLAIKPQQQKTQTMSMQLTDRIVMNFSPNLTKPQADEASTAQQQKLQASSAADQVFSDADEKNGSWLAPGYLLLWKFIVRLLVDKRHETVICWEDKEALVFRIVNPGKVAHLWGLRRNCGNMTYRKFSCTLHYCCSMNILKKIPEKKCTYRFLRRPAE